MTYRPVSIVAPIAASICLLLAGTTGASAQIQCWMGPSAGPPVVNDPHIFCGEIRQRANGAFYATGFHSRPGGVNPVHIPAGGGAPVAIIGGGAVGPAAAGAPAGIYRLTNFTITQGGVTQVKAISTMYPDACNQASVLVAIRNALAAAIAAGHVPPGNFNGPSGGGGACTAGGGAAFNITGYTDAAGAVLTAYPAY
jgi:hypothetical protein